LTHCINDENQNHFVKPEEKLIGTHWNMCRLKDSNRFVPEHVQSTFQYVPITNTIKSLFSDSDFRDQYFNYNRTKHNCVDGAYNDYCCGRIFKQNALFQDFPNSLQIQIFLDGFEVTHPLKSSTNIHAQIGFYFTILNLQHKHAYNLNNVHLVALINANDLKKKETDYNSVWDIIVKDLSILETIGIDVNENTNIKGIYHLINRLRLYQCIFYLSHCIS
jgi:hypothetical protein